MTPEKLEEIARQIEDLILEQGYSVKGSDLRELLKEELADNLEEPDEPAGT